jgi:hypothetical protein
MADNIFSNNTGPTSVEAEMLEIWPFPTPHSHGPNSPHSAPNTSTENEMDSIEDDVYSNDAGSASGEAEMLHALDGMTVDDPPLERPGNIGHMGNHPRSSLKKCTGLAESGSAQNPIDLMGRQLICIDGKMFEVIDLSKDMVCS